jgi:hypothetical protein
VKAKLLKIVLITGSAVVAGGVVVGVLSYGDAKTVVVAPAGKPAKAKGPLEDLAKRIKDLYVRMDEAENNEELKQAVEDLKPLLVEISKIDETGQSRLKRILQEDEDIIALYYGRRELVGWLFE